MVTVHQDCQSAEELFTDSFTAINCMRITSNLYYDRKTTQDNPDRLQVITERLVEAGCGANNRSTQAPYNSPEKPYQCDQFPFVSVSAKQEAVILPINRCVPADQYSSESSHVLTISTLCFVTDYARYRGATHPRTVLQLAGRICQWRNARTERSLQPCLPHYQYLPYCEKRNCDNGMLAQHLGASALCDLQ